MERSFKFMRDAVTEKVTMILFTFSGRTDASN